MFTASVVLYKNPPDECDTILKCLLASPFDVIYLVDHSGDDRLSGLAGRSPKIEYIPHENTGYGAGHNVAIRKAVNAGSRYHLIVNADIIFGADVIPAMCAYMEENQNVGMMMPKVYYPDGRVQYLCKLLPAPLDLLLHRFSPGKILKKRQRIFNYSFTGYDTIMNVPWLSGCFMLCRTSVLQENGGFDERFFMYAEDIDLSRRIHEKYKTVFYPEVSIIHAHKAASKKNFRMLFIHIVNVCRYFRKWGFFFDRERNIINRKALADCKGVS